MKAVSTLFQIILSGTITFSFIVAYSFFDPPSNELPETTIAKIFNLKLSPKAQPKGQTKLSLTSENYLHLTN